MRTILFIVIFSLAAYFSFSWAGYKDFHEDPYGFWHFLTRAPGWANDNAIGSSSLHWLFPYSKEKERAYYNEQIRNGNWK